MMWLDDFVVVKSGNGERTVRAGITSDAVPATFPTDGTDIEGLSASDTLDKGSTIYVVANASVYMLDSTGAWKAQ